MTPVPWCPPDLAGKTAILTGAGGAIVGAIARGLAAGGCAVVICDLDGTAAETAAAAIRSAGGQAVASSGDAADPAAAERALAAAVAAFGRCDILVNGAGGGHRASTTAADLPFHAIPREALDGAFALNFATSVIPSQVVGRHFAERKAGAILNIASIGGIRPLSRALGYTTAKAAVVSFTQWLAVHLAREYAPAIRVNALAPGFVLTAQNRFLLVDEKTGELTARGRQVLAQVPMARFAEPDEIVGGALWLVSDAARFVTGTVVPIDGGMLAGLGV